MQVPTVIKRGMHSSWHCSNAVPTTRLVYMYVYCVAHRKRIIDWFLRGLYSGVYLRYTIAYGIARAESYGNREIVPTVKLFRRFWGEIVPNISAWTIAIPTYLWTKRHRDGMVGRIPYSVPVGTVVHGGLRSAANQSIKAREEPISQGKCNNKRRHGRTNTGGMTSTIQRQLLTAHAQNNKNSSRSNNKCRK